MRRASRAVLLSIVALACARHSTDPPASTAPARSAEKPAPISPIARRPKAALETGARASWFSLRVAEVRWCKSPKVPSLRALGVGIEIENRTDAFIRVRDHDLVLNDSDERKVVRSLPPIGSECPTENLGVLRPRETRRAWLYFAPSSQSIRDFSLSVRLREPHGFDEAQLTLALPTSRGGAGSLLPAMPPPPERPAAVEGIAPAVEAAFYRVTVTGARLCNSGRPLDDGRRLLGVEVLLENFASVDLEPSYTAIVKDGAGVEYESVITEQQGCEPKARVGAQVSPGDRYQSWLWAFPLPEDTKQLVLVYRVRGSAVDAWEEVRIPIGDLPGPPD